MMGGLARQKQGPMCDAFRDLVGCPIELALGDSSLETWILGNHQESHWKIMEISSFGLWPSFHSCTVLRKV